MKIQLSTSFMLRIISVVGIILLLSLQYIWLSNAFKTLEQTLIDKSVECLRIAVDEELNNREHSSGLKVEYRKNDDIDRGEKFVSKVHMKKFDQIKYLINDYFEGTGRQINVLFIDSVFKSKMLQNYGYVPKVSYKILHNSNLRIDSVNNIPEISIHRNSESIIIINRIGSVRFLSIDLNTSTILFFKKGKSILIISILVVLLIGTILIFQFYNFKREEKFSKFIVEYTRMLAHDLMSPISSIRMLINKLRLAKDLDPIAVNTYYQLSIDQSDRMLFNLNSLLYLATTERRELPIKRCAVDVGMLIEKVVERINRLNTDFKVIHLKVHLLPERICFQLDLNLMENVLYNMLDNAVKYSNEIVNISVTCEKTKGAMILKIQDDGFGMTSNVQRKIFEVFDRGSIEGSMLSGYGIGLTFVKKVVSAHRGKITVESKPKWGSIFTIEIPE